MRLNKLKSIKKLLIILPVFMTQFDLNGQNNEVGINISGIVLDADTKEPIPLVNIINDKRNTGAVSDTLGLFQLTALKGDTILFSELGYKKSYFVVPEVLDDTTNYALVQLLEEDTIILKNITIYDFPTEDEFMNSVLSLNLKKDLDQRGFEAQRDIMNLIKDTYQDEKYYYEFWRDRRIYEITGRIQPNQLLNPISWSNFIRDLKSGYYNKKKE
ncbi:MAG TPA: carboxypeptidase-like regulatory domain-containing protein [Cyclobacteriaceae bacterium]